MDKEIINHEVILKELKLTEEQILIINEIISVYSEESGYWKSKYEILKEKIQNVVCS